MNNSTKLKLPFGKKTFTVYGNEDDISSFVPLKTTNTYETGTMLTLKKVIKPSDICIDIGGNIGMITLPLSFLAKNGYVYSFEPESSNYENLQLSLKENNIKNVDVFCCGISDKREMRMLTYENDKLACNHITDTDYLAPVGNIKESLFITIDEFIVERSLKKVNFIKIDVEGAEVKILRSIKDTLVEFRPILIVEIAPSLLKTFFDDTPEDLYKIVSEIYNYVYWIDDETGKLTRIRNINKLNEMLSKSKGWDNIICSDKEVK